MRTRRIASLSWGVVPVAAILCQCGGGSTTSPGDAGGDSHVSRDTGTHHDTGTTHDTGTHHDTGTSHDGGAGGCAGQATAFCQFLSACEPGTLATEYGTVAACESQRTTTCTTNLTAPGTGSSASEVTGCTAQLNTEAQACASGPVPLPVSSSSNACAVVGTGGGGAACGVDTQCQTDVCQRIGTDCGQCTAPGASGAACGPGSNVTCGKGLACSTHLVCATVGAKGATCDFGVTSDCVGGTQCIAGEAGATSGTCQVQGVAVGTACNAKGVGQPDCWAAAGYYCDSSTSSCAKITYSASGSCGEADGGTSDNQCSGGACVAGTCVPAAVSGQACTVDTKGCVDGQVCVASDGGPTGTCTPVNPACPAGDGGTLEFGFSPSNISLAQILALAGSAQVEDVTSGVVVESNAAGSTVLGFNSPTVVVTQPDNSKVNLTVVQSLTVETTGSIVVTGDVPYVIVSLSDITFAASSSLQANGVGSGGGTPGASIGPGGGIGGTAGAGAGLGAGLSASNSSLGAGGGSYCGVGGAGGSGAAGVGMTSVAYGAIDIRPLVGGSGGGGGSFGDGGNSGGGVQLVAAGTISIGASAYITVSGGGAESGASCPGGNSGGGGSGGSILLEAPTVNVAGLLVANGGGGGGGDADDTDGSDGWDVTNVGSPLTAGGLGGTMGPTGAGGNGSTGTTITGAAGGGVGTCSGADTNGAGGGGGAAGRIRINSSTKAATLTGSVSPAATTACLTQGGLRSLAEGP
jgi:hypothetical protein